jgi:hypothetical protein
LSALFYLIIYCLVGSFSFTFHFSGFHLSFLASCLFSVLGKKKGYLWFLLFSLHGFHFFLLFNVSLFHIFSPFLILVFFCSYRLTDIRCPLKTLLHAFFSLFIFLLFLFLSLSVCLFLALFFCFSLFICFFHFVFRFEGAFRSWNRAPHTKKITFGISES